MMLSKWNLKNLIWSIVPLLLIALSHKAQGETTEPRGEIRVVESWRPDVNVLGHNVLQYLYEYALDRNELIPCLAVSRRRVDDTTLELKLREGVRFHNGEPFDADAVVFSVKRIIDPQFNSEQISLIVSKKDICSELTRSSIPSRYLFLKQLKMPKKLMI